MTFHSIIAELSLLGSFLLPQIKIWRLFMVHNIVHLLHWFYYSIHRHRGRRAGSLVVVGCTGCCHSDTSRCVGDGGVVIAEAFYFGASFFVCIFIEPVILSLRTALANWLYLCVYMHICMCYMSYSSITRFYCVHKSHYHFYCVHNYVLQHVLCIWCYYVLLYFVRNDENKKMINQYPFSWVKIFIPVLWLRWRHNWLCYNGTLCNKNKYNCDTSNGSIPWNAIYLPTTSVKQCHLYSRDSHLFNIAYFDQANSLAQPQHEYNGCSYCWTKVTVTLHYSEEQYSYICVLIVCSTFQV